jgi:aspartate/methionine/tyrosine aminotransferase
MRAKYLELAFKRRSATESAITKNYPAMCAASESASLPEIECIEMLEAVEDAYAKRFGAAPFNISHWDPSDEFETEMLAFLEIPSLGSLTAYRFSYQITETDSVITKLGGVTGLHRGLFTPSTTTSILCVLNWLKKRGMNQLIAMCPAYFSLSHVCHRFGLELKRAYMKRSDACFALPPPGSRIWKKPSVLWLTSPVYSAGVYFSEEDIALVKNLLESGWTVISDECLALPGQEMIRAIGRHPNFVSIYSPHKAVCINGIKFSVVIFNAKHLGFMERWADVWYGGLGCSSSLAIAHFLSPNFDSYLAQFLQAVSCQRILIDQLCKGPHVELDAAAKGHFISCYYPTVSSRLGNSRKFLEQLVNATGGSLISGNRSRFGRELGFSFRVNLARGGPRFRPTLARIIDKLNSCAN